MKYYCLTAQEIKYFLSYYLEKIECPDSNLNLMIELAKGWEITLICLNIFVARYIDILNDGDRRLELLYELEHLSLEIQEGGQCFVEYMLHHQRNSNQTLDDAMIEIQTGLSGHNYERTLRY